MGTKIGSGEFTYEVVLDWGMGPEEQPEGWAFRSDALDIAVDSKDRVYAIRFAISQGEHPIIVFDREGKFQASWGAGIFKKPHGITMGPDDTLFFADQDDYTVKKCTLDGKVLMTLGTPGQAAPIQSGRPFNRPGKVAVDQKTGDIYVVDGARAFRVHKFSPDGKLLFSWGEPGTDPGEFNRIHSIFTDRDGYVFVTGSDNHRVQIFDSKGKYMTQWNNIYKATGIYISYAKQQLVYIGELAPGSSVNGAFVANKEDLPNLGARISIYNLMGERLARLGDIRPGVAPNQFEYPHGIAVDSRGDIYVGQIRPERGLRKLVKCKIA